MKKFISTKRFSGFTCCFRQWRAKHTHCSFLHGYAISFKVYFEGDLDENNWVWDFGGMKRAKNKIDGMRPDEWIKYMFDHTANSFFGISISVKYADFNQLLVCNIGFVVRNILPTCSSKNLRRY